jgi:putative spermidine/putrescine transport system permease protein
MITRLARWIMILIFLAYMLIPIYGAFHFSVGPGFTLRQYRAAFSDYLFWGSMRRSLTLALGVVVLSLIICVLAAYWTITRWPEARVIINVLVVLPFVLPGVILSLGLIRVYSHSPIPMTNTPVMLILATSVLTLPYVYRAIDNAFRAVDVRTLTEAATSLGASPLVALLRIILPNVFPGILAGSLLAISAIMAEFTVANLMVGQSYMTFPVYVAHKGFLDARLGTALAILSLLVTIVLAILITFVTRRWSQVGDQGATRTM